VTRQSRQEPLNFSLYSGTPPRAYGLLYDGTMTLSAESSHASFHAIPTRVTERMRIDIELESESHFYAGLRGDVATDGGVFVATHRDLAIGQKVILDVAVDGTCIVVMGIVAWRTPGGADLPCGVGLTFEALAERDRREVDAFCTRRPPFYFDAGDRLAVR
jgi:Tfp pilus assembly protein PilZ